MKKIPLTVNSLVLRTDFSDDLAWIALCAAIQEPTGEFQAYVDFISDREFEDVQPEQVPAMPSDDPDRSFVFLVDHTALSYPEHPILVVDLIDEPGRQFRVILAEIWSVENNLSIGNMGFDEFADAAGSDGVFRGFP